MEDVEFEWDDKKAEANLQKHGVSFEEGTTIFNDPLIATIFDPDHSKAKYATSRLELPCMDVCWWLFILNAVSGFV